MKQNNNYIKKLLVVGFSFVILGVGMFFVQNISIDDKVSAAPIGASHLEPDGMTVKHGVSKNAILKEFGGYDNNGKLINDESSTFVLGEWKGKPVEWRLIWDYGDGTGVAMTKDMIDTVTLLAADGGAGGGTGSFPGLAGKEYGLSYTELYKWMYGHRNTGNYDSMHDGGIAGGFSQDWQTSVGSQIFGTTPKDIRGRKVYEKNESLPIPFVFSQDRLYEQIKSVATPASAKKGYNTNEIGWEDFKGFGLTPEAFSINYADLVKFPGKNLAFMGQIGNLQRNWSYSSKENMLYGTFLNGGRCVMGVATIGQGIRPAISIEISGVNLIYIPNFSDFQEGMPSTIENTTIGKLKANAGDKPYSAISLITSGTTTATDVDENGALVGEGLPLSNAFVLVNADSTNNIADLAIGNTSLTKGVYYVKAKVSDANSEVSEIVIKIDVAAADITGVLTPTQSTSYVYGELQNTDVIGALSATDSNGDVTSLTSFSFVYADGTTLANDSEDGALSISGANVTVKDASLLDASTHSYTMRATKDGKYSDFTFDVIVDKMPLTITTKIGGTSYPTTPLSSLINNTNFGASSYSASATLPYNEVLEVSGTPATYLYRDTTTNSTTTTPETTVGTYKLEVDFPGATADLANNYILTYDNSLLEIVADSFTSVVFAPSKTPLVYGDAETVAGGKVGDFTLTTTGGTTNATYQFVDNANDTSGSTASAVKDKLEIRSNEIYVKSSGKLNAKTYNYYILVTTNTGISHVEPITFTVDKRAVTIQTKIKNTNTHTIDELDPLPIPGDLSYDISNGSFIGTDATGVTYEYYQGNTTTVVTNPASTAGTYELNMNLVDESNYDITKNRAILTVRGNFINSFTFDGDKKTHEYGDIESTSSREIGQLAIGTDTGKDTSGTDYNFSNNASSTGKVSSDGLLTINLDKISVSTGSKLNVGNYSYELIAITPKGLTKTLTITFTIAKRPITVQTSINGITGITNIDVGDTLPTPQTSAVISGSKNFLSGDNVSVTSYQYLKGGNIIPDTTVNMNAGLYDLDVTYSDKSNYAITKNKAQLQVNGNRIKQVDYTGQTSPYTYGDASTVAGINNMLGRLSIQTDTGKDTANPIFELCDNASGANPQKSKGNFMISGTGLDELVVSTGNLDVGTYTLFVKATSKIQSLESDIKVITISVNKKVVNVTIKDPTSINKKVGEDITKRTLTQDVDFEIKTLMSWDTLTGTPQYQYEDGLGYNDMSSDWVGLKIGGLSESNGKSNYDIKFIASDTFVSQDTIAPIIDYSIVGTPGNNGWYVSNVDITALKSDYDEFITSAPVTSLGNPINLTTNGIKNQHIQLRNSTSGAITASTKETIKIDKQIPDFTLQATVGAAAYTSDTPTTGPIHVAMVETVDNVSELTYYYTTNVSDASSSNPKGAPSLWTSLGSGIDFKDFNQPERATYYFKAVSGAGLVSPTAQSIGIYNNSTIPNPVDLKWVNASQYDMVYGDSESLAVMNVPIANIPITYSFKDSNGNAIDVSSCLNIDASNQLHVISGVCSVSDIVVYAQVGNYTTPLQKVITVSKAPITIQALYQNGANFAPTVEILTNDPEPAKKVGLASGSQLVGAETTMGVTDLGTYQYGYVKGGGSSTSSPDLTSIGIYTVTPSFASSTQGILDKYDITWNAATLTINDSNIAANALYNISGIKGEDNWYIQKPVSIQPIHPDFKYMSVNSAPDVQVAQDYATEGDNLVSLVFNDALGHEISKSEQIKIDTMKPTLTIQASSGSNPVYTSNTYTEEDIHINSISQPIGAINPSRAKYYYTLDSTSSSSSPLDSSGNIKNGWIEVVGNFDINNKATYYFKAVSGAGLTGDLVVFIANINKPDYTLQPAVSASSGGKYYAADGSWVNEDVIFTLSGSATGYEVCFNTVEGPCTNWNDILDQSTSTHTISGDVTNQFYYFRIKSTINPYAQSGSFKVSLDKGKPTTPVITLQAKNTGPIARMVNALSFGAWMKEAQEVSMQSSDTLSGLKEIRFDVKKIDGTIVQSDVLYSKVITYHDAAYVLTAKAYDMAGNASELSDEANVFIDLIAPSVEGVKDNEVYYLPYAFVHYRDEASGIDEANTTQSNGTNTTPLGNDTLFSGKGNVSILVSDQAGNTTAIGFRIDALPDMSNWTCSEDHGDVINKVKTQYDELKTNLAAHNMKLSDAQVNEIESWFKKASGTCQISEPENNVTVESEEDRIPENTVLVVDVVTTELKPSEIQVEEDEEIKMAYDVYFNNNGTISKSLNDSTLTIRLPMGAFKAAKGLRLVEVLEDGTVKEIKFVVEEDKAVFKTKVLAKYAFIAEKSNINVDTDNDLTPDVNIDFNGDEKPDINIDIDSDGIPDVNIDTDGDGNPDYNIDINDDGLPDVNIGPIQKPWKPEKCQSFEGFKFCTSTFKKPYLNIDSDEDGRPDINLDLNKDDIPDINIDVNEDSLPDIDIDRDGDGIRDGNIDTNGDGKADENLVNITIWTPDKDVDGAIKYDTMSNLILLPNQEKETIDEDLPNDSNNVLGNYNKNASNGSVGGAGTGDTTGMLISWLLVICSCSFSVLLHFVKCYRKSQAG